MKKVAKILFGIILVAIAIAVAIGIWQWRNINSVIQGVRTSSEEIVKKRSENNEKLVGEINVYLDEKLREPTEEEKRAIESGELTHLELYAKIMEERNSEKIIYDEKKDEFVTEPIVTEEKNKDKNQTTPENKENKLKSENPSEKTTSANNQSGKTDLKSESEVIVNKYISQLYALQSTYTAKLDAIVSQAAAHYLDLRKVKKKDKATARAATVAQFSSVAHSAESECNVRVEALVSNLEAELKRINADLSIVNTIRVTYENEKQLKLSYYANKYLK